MLRLTAAALAVAALAACQPAAATAPPPGTPSTTVPGLTVSPERKLAGYSRERFPHWAPRRDVGASCDVRDVVLRRSGDNVTGGRCGTDRGQWLSSYDDVTLTASSGVDIDHVVPLAEAWRSGADLWSDAQRAAFANDLAEPQLRAVSAKSNRAKGDQDPAKWLPPSHGEWCSYARDWVEVKAHYRLTADQAEVDKLAGILRGCKG